MKYYIKLILILCISSLAGCSNKNVNKHCSENIHIDINSIKNISFSELFDKIEIIPLETNKECIIGIARKIIFHKEIFFIEDRLNNEVLLFNKNGTFRNKIGHIGRGPGEYLVLNDFEIDIQNDLVKILSVDPSRVISYDFNGKHTNTIKIDKMVAPSFFCLAYPDTIYFYSLFDPIKISSYSIKNAKFFNDYDQDLEFSIYSIGKTRRLSPFYKYKDVVLLTETFSNEVYSYSHDGLSCKLKWDFGSHSFNIHTDLPKGQNRQFYSKYLKELNNSKAFYFRNYIENSKFIFTSFLFNYIFRTLVYNKDTETYNLFTEFTEGGFLPDGINFFDNGIYFLVNASDIHETIPQIFLNNEMLQTINKIDIDANSLIIKYYFKNELL